MQPDMVEHDPVVEEPILQSEIEESDVNSEIFQNEDSYVNYEEEHLPVRREIADFDVDFASELQDEEDLRIEDLENGSEYLYSSHMNATDPMSSVQAIIQASNVELEHMDRDDYTPQYQTSAKRMKHSVSMNRFDKDANKAVPLRFSNSRKSKASKYDEAPTDEFVELGRQRCIERVSKRLKKERALKRKKHKENLKKRIERFVRSKMQELKSFKELLAAEDRNLCRKHNERISVERIKIRALVKTYDKWRKEVAASLQQLHNNADMLMNEIVQIEERNGNYEQKLLKLELEKNIPVEMELMSAHDALSTYFEAQNEYKVLEGQLTEKLSNLTERGEELSSIIEQQDAHFSESAEEHISSMQAINVARQERQERLTTLKEDYDNVCNTRNEVEVKINDLKDIIRKEQSEFESELYEKEKALLKEQGEIERSGNDIAQKIETAAEEMLNAEDAIVGLESTLETLNVEHRRVESLFLESQNKIAELESQYGLELRIATRDKRHAEEEKMFNEDIERLQEEKRMLNEKMNELDSEITMRSKEHKDVVFRLKEMEAEIQNLKNSLDDRKKKSAEFLRVKREELVNKRRILKDVEGALETMNEYTFLSQAFSDLNAAQSRAMEKEFNCIERDIRNVDKSELIEINKLYDIQIDLSSKLEDTQCLVNNLKTQIIAHANVNADTGLDIDGTIAAVRTNVIKFFELIEQSLSNSFVYSNIDALPKLEYDVLSDLVESLKHNEQQLKLIQSHIAIIDEKISTMRHKERKRKAMLHVLHIMRFGVDTALQENTTKCKILTSKNAAAIPSIVGSIQGQITQLEGMLEDVKMMKQDFQRVVDQKQDEYNAFRDEVAAKVDNYNDWIADKAEKVRIVTHDLQTVEQAIVERSSQEEGRVAKYRVGKDEDEREFERLIRHEVNTFIRENQAQWVRLKGQYGEQAAVKYVQEHILQKRQSNVSNFEDRTLFFNEFQKSMMEYEKELESIEKELNEVKESLRNERKSEKNARIEMTALESELSRNHKQLEHITTVLDDLREKSRMSHTTQVDMYRTDLDEMLDERKGLKEDENERKMALDDYVSHHNELDKKENAELIALKDSLDDLTTSKMSLAQQQEDLVNQVNEINESFAADMEHCEYLMEKNSVSFQEHIDKANAEQAPEASIPKRIAQIETEMTKGKEKKANHLVKIQNYRGQIVQAEQRINEEITVAEEVINERKEKLAMEKEKLRKHAEETRMKIKERTRDLAAQINHTAEELRALENLKELEGRLKEVESMKKLSYSDILKGLTDEESDMSSVDSFDMDSTAQKARVMVPKLNLARLKKPKTEKKANANGMPLSTGRTVRQADFSLFQSSVNELTEVLKKYDGSHSRAMFIDLPEFAYTAPDFEHTLEELYRTDERLLRLNRK
ncbi:hypothetical protein PCE1_001384 [Barthelona sp. PCE]